MIKLYNNIKTAIEINNEGGIILCVDFPQNLINEIENKLMIDYTDNFLNFEIPKDIETQLKTLFNIYSAIEKMESIKIISITGLGEIDNSKLFISRWNALWDISHKYLPQTFFIIWTDSETQGAIRRFTPNLWADINHVFFHEIETIKPF